MANVAEKLIMRRGAAVALAATARPPRGDGVLPCVGEVIRENTRLRGELHDREVESAALRAENADLRAELGRLRAAEAAGRWRHVR